MSSIRVRFLRGEQVKYISHLDLMKVFDRSLRRANLPIAYSQGFNPHPQMVFGLPLSVGVTSEAEYADFDLTEEIAPDNFGQMLNSSLPVGLKILEAKRLNNKSNIMKEIAAACYDILVSPVQNTGITELKLKFQELLHQPEINVIKEGKKGSRQLDIKPMVYGINLKFLKTGELVDVYSGNNPSIAIRPSTWVDKYVESISGISGLSYNVDNIFSISMLLSAGSVANLKPELLIQALNVNYGLNLKTVKIHRTGLFVNKKGSILDPIDVSALE